MLNKMVLFVMIVLLLVAIVGCSQEKNSGKNMTFTLYYADKDINSLLTEKRTVEMPADANPVQVALMELAKAPQSKDAFIMWPKDAEVVSVNVEDGIIFIDFNDKLVTNFNGGSSAEGLLIASIVNTATDIDGYRDLQVQFLVNGETVESIGGHIETTDPFTRSK